MYEEKKFVVTGRDTGATSEQFSDYVMKTVSRLV
jgi:isocitrate dehydrogenase (NAD+)